MQLLLGRTDADGRAQAPVAVPALRPVAWTRRNLSVPHKHSPGSRAHARSRHRRDKPDSVMFFTCNWPGRAGRRHMGSRGREARTCTGDAPENTARLHRAPTHARGTKPGARSAHSGWDSERRPDVTVQRQRGDSSSEGTRRCQRPSRGAPACAGGTVHPGTRGFQRTRTHPGHTHPPACSHR